MDALRAEPTERSAPGFALESALALALEMDRLEVEIYRSLSVRREAQVVSDRARGAGLDAIRIRADLLASDAASRGGGAVDALVVQRALLAEAAAGGLESLVRRASTYLASTCDRLGMRAETMSYAYAGLPGPDGGDELRRLTSTSADDWGVPPEEATGWRAEALMVVVLMSLSRPGADLALIDRSVEIMRRDGRPAMVAATEANFAEMAAVLGRPDTAVRLARDATATIERHPEAESVLTWESIAVGRLAGGDLVGATAALQRALEIEPVLGLSDSNGDPWLTFAEVCLSNGMPEDGLHVLDAPRRPPPTATWTIARDLKVRAQLHASLEQWPTAYRLLEEHLLAYEQIRSVEGDRAVIDVESRVHVDEERQRAREFQHQAMTDPLTGLANRRAIDQWLDEAAQLDQRAIAVAIVDADHFKSINDTFSHEVGDRVLERLGTCLRVTAQEQLGQPQLVGRLGGEEFIVVWPSGSKEQARNGAERLRARVAALPVLDLGPGLVVTVSIGVALVDDPEELRGSPRTALQRADAALYQAKDAGRNQVRDG